MSAGNMEEEEIATKKNWWNGDGSGLKLLIYSWPLVKECLPVAKGTGPQVHLVWSNLMSSSTANGQRPSTEAIDSWHLQPQFKSDQSLLHWHHIAHFARGTNRLGFIYAQGEPRQDTQSQDENAVVKSLGIAVSGEILPKYEHVWKNPFFYNTHNS